MTNIINMNAIPPDTKSVDLNRQQKPPEEKQPQVQKLEIKPDQQKDKDVTNKNDKKEEVVAQKEKQKTDQEQQEGSSYEDSEESPVRIAISTFTQFFRTHKPVLFICYKKLRDDIEFRYDKLFEKLKSFLLKEKRSYRMFVTVQNFQIDFTAFVDSLELMDLPIGSFLIFQSNFNDLGGIAIEKYKNSFVLRANMKKDSQFQNGYCRFGALEVYQILFSPKILEKQQNIVFDNDKELIRAAKWKGYRTFYLSDQTFLQGLIEWTNLFSMQDLVFKSEDLTALSSKIFESKQKMQGKNFQSKWRIKDTLGRTWIAIADVVGYMIEVEQINFSSQLVKVVNNMYRAMFLKTLNVELAMLEPSINYKFRKQDKQKKLLHYLIEDSPDFIPISKAGIRLEDILTTGQMQIDGVTYEVEGLGGILIVSSLFFMNQEIEKIYDSIYFKQNPEVDNCMQAYIRDMRVVFNALKQINVKSEYFFDLEGKRKFSVVDVNGVHFLNMNPRIKLQITQKLNFFKNYIELREYTKIFQLVEDKQLKFFEISRKAVYHNLAKRINNLLECYEGLETIPEKDILHQIELIFEPHLSYKELEEKVMNEEKLIITSEFPNDINLVLYYLSKSMTSRFKHVKILDFAGLTDEKARKKINDCKKSTQQLILVKNYHLQVFGNPVQIYTQIINTKGQRSFLVVGCVKNFLPLKDNELIAGKAVRIQVVEIKGVQMSQQVKQPRFSDEKLEIITQIIQKFIPNHKDIIMQYIVKEPQFKYFLKVPSMLHQIIQLSKSISKKNLININLLFKVLADQWESYISDEYGKTFLNKVKEELELLTAEYFTISKAPDLQKDGGLYKKCFQIYQQELKRNYKKSLEYETLSFLTFQNNTISFKHQMFAAYFASRFIIKEMDNYNSQLQYIRYFIANPMVRLFLVQKLITMNLRDKLIETVKKSKYRGIIQNNLTNSGIAASLLALIEPNLSGIDFSFCQFPNATLEGCNLYRTDFSYANLLNCYFGRANCYQTLIFRCKHIGSIQYQQTSQQESIKQIKQLIIRNKEAYVIVNNFLQIWQYPFNKTLSTWKQINLKKICMTNEYLIGYTSQNIVQIYNLQNMALVTQHHSSLLIIHDMIITEEYAIMTSNTNCLEQWWYRPYLEFLSKDHTETQNQKIISKFKRLFYAMRRVCSIVSGEESYFYIGSCEGVLYKYNIKTLNIVNDLKVSEEGELSCLGYFEGKRTKKLMTFSDDLSLKLFHVEDNTINLIWEFKQFQILKYISANDCYVYAMSGHAVSVYGQSYTGRSTSKVSYFRQDGLNFSSAFEDKVSNKLLVSHMKGVLTIPFNSQDIYKNMIEHQYSITTLTHIKMPVSNGQSKSDIDVIISGGLDMKIMFWEMNSLQVIACIDLDCSVSKLRVFNNLLFVASEYFYILVYSLETFDLVGKLSECHQGAINYMTMYEDLLYVCCADKNIVKYRAGDLVYKSKITLQSPPTSIVCGIDYFQCIVGTEYGKIIWIDDKNYSKYQLNQHKTAVEQIIIDEHYGYSCSSEALFKWGIKSREVIAQILIPASTFTGINFYKQHIIATINNSIMFLDRDLKELKRYPVHANKIRCAVYHEPSETVFSAGDDRSIKKFDISKGFEKMVFEISMPKRLALNNVQFT